MKITVDARPLLFNRTGIGQYTYNMLKAFQRFDRQNEYYLCGLNNLIRKTPLSNIADDKEYIYVIKRLNGRVPFPFKKIVRLTLTQYASLIMKMIGVNIFWGPNFLGYFNKSFKSIITIHDMAYQYYPATIHPFMLKELRMKLYDHAHRADAIISVSANTKKDIVRFLRVPSEKVHVIYNGVNKIFKPISDERVLGHVKSKYKLPNRYILFVGMIEPRKNLMGLIRAYDKLNRQAGFNHALVIVGGKGWNYESIFEEVGKLGFSAKVIFAGYVPDEDLPTVYNLASVFVFPSFYEGFGMPLLEAMACGTPVVTSRVSSLPEVGGEAALYVNPGEVEEIAEAIKKVVLDHGLRKSLIEKGLARSKEFSWENAARRTLKVFEDVSKCS